MLKSGNENREKHITHNSFLVDQMTDVIFVSFSNKRQIIIQLKFFKMVDFLLLTH